MRQYVGKTTPVSRLIDLTVLQRVWHIARCGRRRGRVVRPCRPSATGLGGRRHTLPRVPRNHPAHRGCDTRASTTRRRTRPVRPHLASSRYAVEPGGVLEPEIGRIMSEQEGTRCHVFHLFSDCTGGGTGHTHGRCRGSKGDVVHSRLGARLHGACRFDTWPDRQPVERPPPWTNTVRYTKPDG